MFLHLKIIKDSHLFLYRVASYFFYYSSVKFVNACSFSPHGTDFNANYYVRNLSIVLHIELYNSSMVLNISEFIVT